MSEKQSINHPQHYNQHPSGIECIEIIQHMNFNLGSSMKYIWRSSLKHDDATEDLEKAIWLLEKEVKRINKYEK